MIIFVSNENTMAEYPYLENGDLILDDRHQTFKIYGERSSQCASCKHFISQGYYCEAFPWPQGIPDSILSGEKKHEKVWDSQKGNTVYTAVEE